MGALHRSTGVKLRSCSYLIFATTSLLLIFDEYACLRPDIPPSFEILAKNLYASGRIAPQAHASQALHSIGVRAIFIEIHHVKCKK